MILVFYLSKWHSGLVCKPRFQNLAGTFHKILFYGPIENIVLKHICLLPAPGYLNKMYEKC